MTMDEFDGLTATDCASGCGPNGCVISGSTTCGHPRKGGLQPRDMMKPDAVERFSRARKFLAHDGIDKRFG